MMNADIGRYIGLDIQSGEVENTLGIGGALDAYLHEVTLFLPGGPETVTATFVEGLPVAGLLGMTGFFDKFIVKFEQPLLQFEIEKIGHA